MLRNIQTSGLGLTRAIDPGTLSPIVDLFGANGLENAGNYEYITNTGSLGGRANATILTAAFMPSVISNSFSANSAFSANRSPGFTSSGADGKGFNMSLNNGFKGLHLTVGTTLFISCKMNSALNVAQGYGLFYSDMTGVPGNIGIHVKYFSASGQFAIDVGNGPGIHNITTGSGAIEINKYYTIAVRVIAGTATNVRIEAWLNAIRVGQTPEFIPSSADSDHPLGRIGNYVATHAAACFATFNRLVVIPDVTNIQLQNVHNFFISKY